MESIARRGTSGERNYGIPHKIGPPRSASLREREREREVARKEHCSLQKDRCWQTDKSGPISSRAVLDIPPWNGIMESDDKSTTRHESTGNRSGRGPAWNRCKTATDGILGRNLCVIWNNRARHLSKTERTDVIYVAKVGLCNFCADLQKQVGLAGG